MQISPELAAAFNLDPSLEVYDNSTLSTIDSCIRKAYWKLMFQLPVTSHQGIQERVGVAAHYGTAIHSAMDKMYSPILYKQWSLEKRKIAAFKAFSTKYATLIPDHDMVEDPYSHPCGIRLLDDYFAHYEEEDKFYIPIETEWTTIVLLTDLSPPCYFISRGDGLLYRPAMEDYLVREFKTTKSSLQNKIDELVLSRQCEGYVWGISQPELLLPKDKPVTGILADVLAVRTKEKDPTKLFKREIIHKSDIQLEVWRRDTIAKIERWREIRVKAARNTQPLLQYTMFDRNANECMRYGKCSYYNLCAYGIDSINLDTLQPNDWNPLHSEKMEIP